jgi:hypothetical protein
MTRRVPPSAFGVAGLDDDERVRHAARLLLSGFDLDAVAAICGLPVALVRRLAATVVDEFARAAPESVTAPADLRALFSRFRSLAALAAAGGAEAAWLDETAGAVASALLELEEYRSGGRDPRRRDTLTLAARVQRERARGASIGALQVRFGRSRAEIYRLISIVSKHHKTVAVFTARNEGA